MAEISIESPSVSEVLEKRLLKAAQVAIRSVVQTFKKLRSREVKAQFVIDLSEHGFTVKLDERSLEYLLSLIGAEIEEEEESSLRQEPRGE